MICLNNVFFQKLLQFFVHPICIFLFHLLLCNYSFIIANPIPVNHEFTDKKATFSITFSFLAPFSVLTTMKVYEDTAQKQDRIWYGYQPQQFFTDVSSRWMCHHFNFGHIGLKRNRPVNLVHTACNLVHIGGLKRAANSYQSGIFPLFVFCKL